MEIQIAKMERFSQSGKSLLKLIQNYDMPTLDLLVRESIQNSLDAYDSKRNSKDVTVEFNTGKFVSNELSHYLDGISENLDNIYGNNEQTFISMSDSNTVGLTGDVEDPEGEGDNLHKLIYEICQAQQSEGAGGSWGIGKTVYFRAGIGLVLYYSRVKLDNGEYQDRMAATMVEDETKNDTIIPQYKEYKRRGVAWWGRRVEENLTIPIIDSDEISKILDIFGLKKYEGEKTGTVIIIPYVDEDSVLKENMIEDTDNMGNKHMPYWQKDIESYLKIAVQKWYIPRLNNIEYPYGPYLRVIINDKVMGGIGPENEDIEPLYQVVRALYDRATLDTEEYNDILSGEETHIENIIINGSLDNTNAGQVVFVKVNKELLGMTPPNNKLNPLTYINKERLSYDTNKPIVSYCRTPGMIVSYDISSEWTEQIPNTEIDYFIVGVFVLNSHNKLRQNLTGISLEEYVRSGELADHTSWRDKSINNSNPKIISRIKYHTSRKISYAYREVEEEKSSIVNSGYSKFFGDLLLPPDGFGKEPSIIPKPTPSRDVIHHKGITLTLLPNNIEYKDDCVILPFEAQTKLKPTTITIETLVMTPEQSKQQYSVEDWHELVGVDIPFEIVGFDMNVLKWEKEKCLEAIYLDNENKEDELKDYKVKFIETANNERKGVVLSSNTGHSMFFKGKFKIRIKRKDFKITLGANTEKGE